MSAGATDCPGCGAHLAPDAHFCSACGRRVAPADEAVVWTVTDRRTFGVMPGRAAFRSARARIQHVVGIVRGRLATAFEIVRARLEADLARVRIRRSVAALRRERTRCVQELGEAALGGAAKDVKSAKERVLAVEERLETAAGDRQRVEEHRRDRIDRARREGGTTRVVQPARN
jgi:uncharacterized OB-fold protein